MTNWLIFIMKRIFCPYACQELTATRCFLEFAQQEDPDGMELYRELAVYDLYLRENAKSRPAFALDEKPHHDQIVEFYQEEEKNRTYLPGV